MSENNQVVKLLAERFNRAGEHGRIVFWRDVKGEFEDSLETFVGENASDETLRGVELLKPEHEPFNARYRMFREAPERKFLVYMTGEAPALEDDWLLDLELAYGPIFSADKLTMVLVGQLPEPDAGVRGEWVDVMRRTPKFFDNADRVDRFAKRLTPRDNAEVFQAKMVATLLRLKDDRHSMQSIWAELLTEYADGDESGIDEIEKMGLGEFHWSGTRKIYHFDVETDDEPTLRDFVLWLFQLAWNGFAGESGTAPYAGIRRDWEDWYGNVDMRRVLRDLSIDVVDDLRLNTSIMDMGVDELAGKNLFREVDNTLVSRLFERLGYDSITDDEIQRIVTARRGGLWYEEYEPLYACIAAASRLRATLNECSGLLISVDSPERGIELYASELYKADRAYREYVTAWRRAHPEARSVDTDLQESYRSYQHALGQAWQMQVDKLERWSFKGVDAQSDFYEREISPVVGAKKKIAVIVSDALRYEAAQELAERINRENRFSTDLKKQYGVLPSYTQLGMAALLPHDPSSAHDSLAFGKDHYGVLVDGRSATGTENRDAILGDVGGKAIQAGELLKMKSIDVKALYRSCNVLYVYHNVIDAHGDSDKTEDEVFDSCETAFRELTDVVKKLAGGNVNNMIITSDHGFLYQGFDLDDSEWLSTQPQGDEVWVKKRRFTIGSRLAPDRAFITFTAAQAGLDDPDGEGVTIQIPNSIMRLRKQGTGSHYVHGGSALPEIVVPVLHVSKGRSAAGDARPVEFRIMQGTDRITGRQLTVEFFQEEPVEGKVQARTVFAGLWGREPDGRAVLVSNETPVAFDMTSKENSGRHVTATLMLTSDADRFNGRTLELRLRENTAGSNVRVTLDQCARYAFKQGMGDDVDDFFG